MSGGKLSAHVESSIPIRSIKSTHKGMDEVMQQAMNAADHPKIQYRLGDMTLKEPHAAGTPFPSRQDQSGPGDGYAFSIYLAGAWLNWADPPGAMLRLRHEGPA